jgi:nucleoid DNA-binding protein
MSKYKKVLKRRKGYTYKHPKTGKKVKVPPGKQHYRIRKYQRTTNKDKDQDQDQDLIEQKLGMSKKEIFNKIWDDLGWDRRRFESEFRDAYTEIEGLLKEGNRTDKKIEFYRFVEVKDPKKFIETFDKNEDYAGEHWTLNYDPDLEITNQTKVNVKFTGITERSNIDVFESILLMTSYPREREVALQDSNNIKIKKIEEYRDPELEELGIYED